MRACLDSLVSIALISAIGVVFVMDDSHGNPPPQPIPTTETPQPELPPPLPQFEPPVEFVNFEPPVPELPKIDPPKDFAPPIDRTPRLRIGFDDDFRAGIVTTSGNPDDPADDNKKLTYSEIGSTNNTRLFVDGLAPELGKSPGQVTRSNQKTARGEFESIYMFRGVRLTRQLTLIPGAVSRRMDVVRVTYLVENIDRQPHNVGLRVMLDTLIGNNDGVPFIVPGTDGIVTSPVVYRSGNIPDFVRALENPDLQNPGVIVDIGLRVDAGVESPNEVVLSFWPGSDAKWDYDRLKPFGKDTCIGMFYLKRDMQPGEKRVMSYTYGLGSISSTRTQNAAISLTAGGPFRAGGKFWLVALVQNPQAGQRVAISLPTGVTLGPNEQAEKPVPPSKTYSQISWLLSVADRAEGQALLKAKLLPDDTEETQTIDIEARKARLKLIADGPITSGGAFWLTGVVPNPLQGQEVEITLPQGLSLNPQDPARKPVPSSNKGYSLVSWLVQVGRSVEGSRELSGRLNPDNVAESISVDVQPAKPMLKLMAKSPVPKGKPFWVVALVQNPRDGQHVELELPNGLELTGDDLQTSRRVETDKSFVQIPFLVKSSRSGRVEFKALLKPHELTAAVSVEIEVGSLVQ